MAQIIGMDGRLKNPSAEKITISKEDLLEALTAEGQPVLARHYCLFLADGIWDRLTQHPRVK